MLGIVAYEMGTGYLPALIGDMKVGGTPEIMYWTGLAQSAGFFISLFSTPYWARVGESLGRKAMVIRAHLGLAISLLWISLARTPTELVVARTLQGMLAGITAAAVCAVAEDEDAPYRISWLHSSTLIGAIIGPFIGAACLTRWPTRSVFSIGSGLCLASSAVAFLLMPERRAPNVSQKTKVPTHLPSLKRLIPYAMAVWVFACLAMEDPVLSIYTKQLCGPSLNWMFWTAAVLSASRLTAALSAPLWGRLATTLGPTAVLHMALCGSGLLALGQVFASDPFGLMTIRALFGIFAAAIATSIYSLAAKDASPERKGRVTAMTYSAGRLGESLGNALGGGAAYTFGMRGLFVGMGAGLLAAVFFNRKNQETVACEKSYLLGTSLSESTPVL
jgi:MFS family permease